MTFAYPWFVAAPILYLILRWTRRAPRSTATFPSASFLGALPTTFKQKAREPLLNILTFVTICALSLAAARPQKITVVPHNESGRNIILVVDASNSMSAQDFPTSLGRTSRMEGIKSVVAEYVRARAGDRVGLVVFGNTGYLQSPLTTDTALVEELVRALQPRMAGDGTAIGDGLGLALKRLREVKEGTKAIILMTDGVNNAGQVSPIKAAHVAKDLGIQVHTIGIGTESTPMMNQPLGGILGMPTGPMAEFDEKTLKEIAELTGGAYFNAANLEDFKKVYREIEKLTSTDQEQPDKTIIDELFAPCLLVATIAYMLAVVLAATYFLKIP